MSEENKEDKTQTPEELEQEKKEEAELSATPDEAEVKSKIIEDLGLDEDTDSELIDKLTKNEIASRKKFGKLVGQKRGWRETAQKKKEDKKPPKTEEKKTFTEEDLDKRLDERDRKRDLESLDVSDELRKEVESYAKLHGLSVKKATESPYIKFKKDEEDKKVKIEKAGVGEGGSKTQIISNIKEKSDEELTKAMNSLDLSNKEGQKKHDELKAELKSRG